MRKERAKDRIRERTIEVKTERESIFYERKGEKRKKWRRRN